MKVNCIAALEEHLQASFAVSPLSIAIERPPSSMAGDLVVNCFRLAGALRRNPLEIAMAAAEFLSRHSDVEAVDQIKAYVNLSLTSQALFEAAVADPQAPRRDGVLPTARRQRIVVEYSAPNTNKPQHLGHVRNNTLGQAAVSLLRRVGHKVVAVNLVNDRGIHICKSMLAYQRFGHGETPQDREMKGDHLVGDYYVKFDQEYRRQVEQLREAQPELRERADEELFLQTEIGRAVQEMLVKWEAEDPQVRALWRTMNQWVLAGFDQTYLRLGVAFDRTYLESETYGFGRQIVLDALAKGIFKRREDGATVVDLSDEKLGEKVVLRSDSTSVYVTQDIGTTAIKHDDWRPQRQIWVVGDEQIFHFKVLFAILRKLGFPWAQTEDALCHMAYGMVNLPSGRMKSREGTVVDADDLLDEMESLAQAATLQRYEEAPNDLAERSRAIGLGALKFMLLKVNPKTTILFDPEASLKFEGDTGPYILYAYARICSMLRKADDSAAVAKAAAAPVDWSVPGVAAERDLALSCGVYGEVLQRAAAELDTSILAGYLLELSKAFSRFYRECPVLNADSDKLAAARLELCRRVRDILADGLYTLGIETLDSM